MPLLARSLRRDLTEQKRSFNDFAILMDNAEKQRSSSPQRLYRLYQLMSFILSNCHMNETLHTNHSFRLLTIEKCNQYSTYPQCTPELAETCFKLLAYVNTIMEKLNEVKQ